MALKDELAAHAAALEGLVDGSADVIDQAVDVVCHCFEQEGKLLICGNGGSAADAQHIAAEFVNRLRFDRSPLPALALTTDTSVLTCIANDASYDNVFARQVAALGKAGDILLAISTSGGSPNVLAALKTARQHGLHTMGLTGEAGVERMADYCDLLIAVPSPDCARIQEGHEFVGHFIAGMVEQRLFRDTSRGASNRGGSR